MQGLNLNIRGTTEERHRMNNVHDKSHATGMKNNNFKKPIECAQPRTSGVTSDSLGPCCKLSVRDRMQAVQFCLFFAHVDICKADFVPYKLL